MDIRFHIRQFSTDMENKMRKHDEDKGTHGWVSMDPKILLEKLMGEVLELSDEMIDYPKTTKYDKIMEECADIANYAMMISNITRKKIYE